MVNNVTKVLDISNKTVREREAGLHTFDFVTIDSKEHMIITYSGTDDIYHLSAFEILNNSEIGNEKTLALLGSIKIETYTLVEKYYKQMMKFFFV